MQQKSGVEMVPKTRKSLGRPKIANEAMKKFSFDLPESQHLAGSEKSGAGRIFNLSLYFRLIHKYKFLGRNLEESQREMNELHELELKEAAEKERKEKRK